MMTITVNDAETLADVVAELVKKGLTFETKQDGSKFVITMLGGF